MGAGGAGGAVAKVLAGTDWETGSPALGDGGTDDCVVGKEAVAGGSGIVPG